MDGISELAGVVFFGSGNFVGASGIFTAGIAFYFVLYAL